MLYSRESSVRTSQEHKQLSQIQFVLMMLAAGEFEQRLSESKSSRAVNGVSDGIDL